MKKKKNMKWTIILVFLKANFSFFSLAFVKFPFFAHVHVIFQWLQNVGIFAYSRKDITDEDLRSIIEATLTCRVDHQYVADTSLKLWLSVYTLLHSILYYRLCNLVSDFTRKSLSTCDKMKCMIFGIFIQFWGAYCQQNSKTYFRTLLIIVL